MTKKRFEGYSDSEVDLLGKFDALRTSDVIGEFINEVAQEQISTERREYYSSSFDSDVIGLQVANPFNQQKKEVVSIKVSVTRVNWWRILIDGPTIVSGQQLISAVPDVLITVIAGSLLMLKGALALVSVPVDERSALALAVMWKYKGKNNTIEFESAMRDFNRIQVDSNEQPLTETEFENIVTSLIKLESIDKNGDTIILKEQTLVKANI